MVELGVMEKNDGSLLGFAFALRWLASHRSEKKLVRPVIPHGGMGAVCIQSKCSETVFYEVMQGDG